ncbi:MAG: sulfide/dihydroorotate dehydrogenase-like FAD/NAD-binding protein [Candidatus Omnitrophota bacterium]
MMFKIINKKELAEGIKLLEVNAPIISQKAKPGQFVVVIVDSFGERIPLTIADWDSVKGTITLIFQEVGFSTRKLGELSEGDKIYSLLGPLGRPTEIAKFGTVVCVGGGVGVAELFPVARAFKEAGNSCLGIIGSRSKNLLILEDEMKSVSKELYITTDDGSYGQKGFVTEILRQILNRQPINLVYAIGPVLMMEAVAKETLPFKIKTVVSLNPIMVDATGMCGACRCKVAGKTVFGCVDGPEFDAHLVDFKELRQRLNSFKEQEQSIFKTCENKNPKKE